MKKAILELDINELAALKKLVGMAAIGYKVEEEYFKNAPLETSEDYQKILDAIIDHSLHENLEEKIKSAMLSL